MKRVLIQCEGRLANHLIAWAKAYYFLKDQDCELWIDYPEWVDCTLPKTRIGDPKCELMECIFLESVIASEFDCAWDAKDLWYREVPREEIVANLRLIRPPKDIADDPLSPKHIGIHVRCGDYLPVDWTNPPIPLPPFWRASDYYYESTVSRCMEVCDVAPLFLATDGTLSDVGFIVDLYNPVRGVPGDPLYDLFRLASCRVIVGSMSTFSQVASIIGDVPLILPVCSANEVETILERVKC